MSDDLIIKIGADATHVSEAYDNIKAKTEDLEKGLEKIAKISGVAFAALSAQVGISLVAFKDAQDATKSLNLALQNQGIYTDQLAESYRSYSEAISKKTGLENDEITKAQAVAQGYIGQTKITKELTQAIADLAEGQKISLTQAAEAVGKAISHGTGELVRQGLVISQTSTEQERMAATLSLVQTRFGGMAEAANTGLGSIRGLQNAFHESQEELGARFAPAATLVIQKLTEFLTPSKEASGIMTDLKAGFIAAGLAVTGLGLGLPILAQGFLTVRAAALALNVSLSATKIALAGLGIGLIIIALTELVTHWSTVSTRVQAIVKGMGTFIAGVFGGIGSIIKGAMLGSLDYIKDGLEQMKTAFKQGSTEAFAEIPKAEEKALTQQEAVKKEFADKAEASRKEQESRRIALRKAEDQLVLLELKNASQEQIDLKTKEIQTLKAIESNQNKEQVVLLKQRLAQIRQLEAAQQKEDLDRKAQFAKLEIQADESLSKTKMGHDKTLEAKEQKQILAGLHTERDAKRKIYADELKDRVAAENQRLEDTQRYGAAYAAINEALHSKEVQGFQKGTGELVKLTNSKNSTLKEIGKAASVADITIKTAESAMNIVAGFSAIPFVGFELGIAAAAAVIAYGAEQIGDVLSAADGGLVTGGVAGRDSVPALLMPGELVTPAKNFEEVVNSVSHTRAMKNGTAGGGMASLQLSLKDNLMDFIETKLVERKNLNISLQRT